MTWQAGLRKAQKAAQQKAAEEAAKLAKMQAIQDRLEGQQLEQVLDWLGIPHGELDKNEFISPDGLVSLTASVSVDLNQNYRSEDPEDYPMWRIAVYVELLWDHIGIYSPNVYISVNRPDEKAISKLQADIADIIDKLLAQKADREKYLAECQTSEPPINLGQQLIEALDEFLTYRENTSYE